jgi:excisionase family DNA binding protein
MPRKPSSPPGDPSVTLAEAASRYGVSTRTLRRWVADGRLPAWRVGPRLIRVAPADVAALARPVPTITPPPREGPAS